MYICSLMLGSFRRARIWMCWRNFIEDSTQFRTFFFFVELLCPQICFWKPFTTNVMPRAFRLIAPDFAKPSTPCDSTRKAPKQKAKQDRTSRRSAVSDFVFPSKKRNFVRPACAWYFFFNRINSEHQQRPHSSTLATSRVPKQTSFRSLLIILQFDALKSKTHSQQRADNGVKISSPSLRTEKRNHDVLQRKVWLTCVTIVQISMETDTWRQEGNGKKKNP